MKESNFMKSFIFSFATFFLLACSSNATDKKMNEITQTVTLSENEQVAYFASGCFWCVEEIFESIIGVKEVISGYAGGHTPNPTYTEVCSGTTGHAETVQIIYDPNVVSFEILLDAFFASHDPTSVNRQGPDSGTQYRSIAFYSNDKEKEQIEAKIKALNESNIWKNPIVTEVKKIDKFWPAEGYHQNYSRLNVGNPYVRNVSIPRYNRFVESFDQNLIKH